MPTAHVNGIDIAYEVSGDPADPALLLVMGLGAQLIVWPEAFINQLTKHGLYVISYDNRDVGLSTKLEGLPDVVGLFGGDFTSAPYTIEDMADDGVALLRHLGIAKAHVAGASMGGMIVQAMVIHHPDVFITATSVMSTTGDRSVGQPTGEALSALLRPIATNRDEAIAGSVEGAKIIGSPGYPAGDDVVAARAAESYDRGYFPEGTARQLASILSAVDRTEGLHGVTIPFLVIHGEADPLVQPSGGEATAAAVPGAKLLTIPGMGHDLPDELIGQIVDAIIATTELASV
ncbi:MAG TPA: alpha/beta hydrolase [Acidimicrobiales bacterium]|nr:alpha/beta hydrolase [Acidimicrobiales bacterium]